MNALALDFGAPIVVENARSEQHVLPGGCVERTAPATQDACEPLLSGPDSQDALALGHLRLTYLVRLVRVEWVPKEALNRIVSAGGMRVHGGQ